MRLICPSDGALAAERRLAACMLCMEHGAQVYGPDLKLNPPPHQRWPIVPLAPVTDRGLAAEAYYRPTVGLIFYTAGPAFNVRKLAGRLKALLDVAGDAHLKRHRTVAATPFSVLRHRGRVAGGTIIAGQRRVFNKPAVEKEDLPARMIAWAPAGAKPPPHYSIQASFTWVFMPATAAFTITAIETMTDFNALVASILYDDALVARRAEGADFFHLSAEDFEFLTVPAALAGPLSLLGRSAGALIVAEGGLAFVGQHLCLWADPPRSHAHLPWVEWTPEGVATTGPGRYQCCLCEAPIGGAAILVQAPLAPVPGQHRDWYPCDIPAGEPLVRGINVGKSLLLCPPCWGAFEAADCLSLHLGARVSQTTVPYTQAQVCAACPGYEWLVPLLKGSVRSAPGIPHAFIVQLCADGAGSDSAVLLAGEKLGPYPALTTPGVAALRLPIASSLRLAERQLQPESDGSKR